MKNSQKSIIEKIVKFGVPFLVILAMIYIQYFARHNGDAEFGAIGEDASLTILLLLFLILYFISGVIVWLVSKKNFILLSSIFSITVVFIYYIIMVSYARYDMAKEDKRVDEYIKNELVESQRKYDSLTVIIKKSDNNSKLIEERAIIFLSKINKYNTLKEKIEKHTKELELAVENNTKNIEVYNTLYYRYLSSSEHEKNIKMLETALKTLDLSEKDKKKYEGRLENAQYSQKEKIRRIKVDKEWQEQETERNNLLVENLTKKFKEKGFNDTDLAKRGYTYRQLDKPNEALADFNKAIELNPENRTAIVQKAHVLSDLKQYDEAILQYKKCISKYPQNKGDFQKLIDKIKEIKY